MSEQRMCDGWHYKNKINKKQKKRGVSKNKRLKQRTNSQIFRVNKTRPASPASKQLPTPI